MLVFKGEGLLVPFPAPKLAYHPLSVVCVFLFNIRSYSSYLEAVSSIRSLGTRHVALTRDPLNVVLSHFVMYNLAFILFDTK
jgi:hypothetical protein